MGSSISDKICNRNKDNLTNTLGPSESTAAQESSIFGDISNLSPVQPFKDAAILQGFPGMISPPNVFTSPNINPPSSILNRQQQCHASSSGYFPENADYKKTNTVPDDPGSTNSELSIAVISSDQKGSNATTFTQLQPVNALIAVDELLVAPSDEELFHSRSREILNDAPKSEVCTNLMSNPYMDHVHAQRECEESLNEVSHIQNGVLRRCLQFDERQHKSISKSSDDTTERQISISDISQSFSPNTPYNRHEADQFEFASTLCLPSNPKVVVSKPRSIGLHLNSIVAGPPINLVTGKKSSKGKGMVKLRGKSLIISGVDAHAISSNNVEHISLTSEGDLHINESVEMNTPNRLLLPNNAKPLDLPILLNQAGEEFAESTGESNQADSNKGRKQASGSANPDGCKRCCCKKSKCLKLYCDCFAAGLYCADSCSCQGCFNRPEFKDTVVEARQLVESRNPLAFAPRIMQHVTNSPTNSGESVEPVAQPSLRHKRGCNCRKSMCLKKYCECYEANVGCSDGCRCEGCKNVYGKKPDYSLSRHITNKQTFDDITEETPNQKRKLLTTSRSHLSLDNKVNDLPLAVPVTPTLPSSDSRKNEMKSLLPGRRYVLSPEPNLHTPPSTMYQSSRNPAEATQLTPSIHGGLVNLCQITQLTNTHQPTPMAQAPSSNTRNIREEPPFCETVKSKLPEFLSDAMENDTPVILRDFPAPVKFVKVSSPNKKRISPPHNHLNELLPSLSGELRSSRKFVFRSVPKFPCLDSNSPSEPPADTH